MFTATSRRSAARRCRLLAAALPTLLLLVPASAHAEAWLRGPSFGGNPLTGGALAGAPALAADASGTAAVAWPEQAVGSSGILARVARISPDGVLGSPQTLGAVNGGSSVAVASAPSGATVAAWLSPESAGVGEVQFAALGADGTPGPIRTLYRGTSISRDTLAVAVDDAGDAVVTWIAKDPGSPAIAVQARRVGADGTPGPAVVVPGVGTDADPQVAIARSGAAWLSWQQVDGGPQAAWVARLTAAGALDGAPVRVSTAGEDAAGHRLAANGDAAVVQWMEATAADPVLRFSRLGAAAALAGPAQTVASIPGTLSPPAVTLGPDGTVTAVWMAITGSGLTPSASVRMRRIDATGVAGPEQQLSAPGSLALAPQADGAADGTVTATWIELASRSDIVRNGLQVSSGGLTTPAREISEVLPTTMGDIAWVASSGLGSATVGWMKVGSGLGVFATSRFDGVGPKVTASVPATVALGADAAFDATVSDSAGIAGTWWEFGDDSGSRRTAVRHRYAAPGTYTVTLTATDKADNTTTVTRQVTVVAPAPSAERVSAALKLTKVSRTGAKVTVAGTLDKRAGGKVTIAYAQKIGRRSLSKRVTAKIVNGRFSATVKLSGALAKARGGKATVNVSYAGDADTNTASAKRTLANPKPASR